MPDEFAEILKQASLFRSLAGQFATAILTKTRTGMFMVAPDDYGVGVELRKNGVYGEGEIIRYSRYLNSNSKVLILGAHIGTLAIPLSRLSKQVTAIEANPASFELLQLNLLLNQVSNCDTLNIAAGNRFEEISFLANLANSGGSKRKPLIEDRMYTYDNPSEIKVSSAPLDELLVEKNYDLIIMDIEGSEYFALKGMQRLLRSCSVLAVEFVPHHLKNVGGVSVQEFLDAIKDFRTLTIPSKGLTLREDQFLPVLEQMYAAGQCDDGIIFER